MPTLEASGTKTTAASEDTLATTTNAGVFEFSIDTNAMALGDKIIIRTYTTILSAGTSRLFEEVPYEHPQGLPIKKSLPCASNIEYHVTIQRIAGSDRSYPWKILKL